MYSGFWIPDVCECECFGHFPYLHGHLPGPGVRLGPLTVHNSCLKSWRNGWFPAGAGPV